MINEIAGRARAFGVLAAIGLLAGCAQPAAAPPPNPEPAATMAPELVGAWYQVFFETGKSDIDARGQAIVATVANVVKSVATTRVSVIGRADRVGAAATNLALSERRAEQVRNALIAAGVPADRIATRWTGEFRQRVATGNDVDAPGNRVVDITVIKESS
jgi:OOP family OmpA-OmpF porin